MNLVYFTYRGDHDLLMLSHFTSGGSEWRTNCLSEHSMRKRPQPAISVKTDTMVSQRT